MEKDILRTGFIDLDKTINLYEPKLIFLAGRPGMGKTAFAVDIASNICLKQDIPVLILSIEESKNSVINRIIAKESRIDISKIRLNELNAIEENIVQIQRKFIENSKIFIEDIGLQSVGKVIELIKKYVNENNVKFIAIDYLQLMRYTKMSDIRVENILRQLKQISKELKISILITSQLSRSLLERDDCRPNIKDLINKEVILKYADIIMFLYRENDFYKNPEKKDIAEVIIIQNDVDKIIKIIFEGKYSGFKSFKE